MNDDDNQLNNALIRLERERREQVERNNERLNREFRRKHKIPEIPDDPPKGYDMSAQRTASNTTAEQKLAFANRQAFERERERALQAVDAPLTDAEIAPYSQDEFLKLRPELRLDIMNQAKAVRLQRRANEIRNAAY
jgi:hypothetical protein